MSLDVRYDENFVSGSSGTQNCDHELIDEGLGHDDDDAETVGATGWHVRIDFDPNQLF